MTQDIDIISNYCLLLFKLYKVLVYVVQESVVPRGKEDSTRMPN